MDISGSILMFLLLFLRSSSFRISRRINNNNINSIQRDLSRDGNDLILTYDPQKKVDFSDISISSYIAYVNSSFEMFSTLQSSCIVKRPTLINILNPNLEALTQQLHKIANLFASSEVFWKPTILLRILSASLTDVELSTSLSNTSFRKVLENINIQSQVFIILEDGNETWKTGYEIYAVKSEIFLKVVEMRFIGPYVDFFDTMITRRKNLRGTLIKGVTQDDQDLNLIARFEDINGETKFSSGVSVVYFKMMADGLNFRVGAVRGTGWISQSPNGTLLGMAQQLINGSADVLIAYSELLPYRLNGLRYLQPYYMTKVRAFFQQPPPNAIRNIFFNPLQPQLWISLVALWLFTITTLKYAYSLRAKYMLQFQEKEKINCKSVGMQINDEKDAENHNDKIIARDALMWGIASACGQGWHMLPQSGSMKLIMLSGLITFMLSYTAYSAAILTNLSIFLDPIKGWSDLNSSGYKIYGDKLLQSSTTIANKGLSRGLSDFVSKGQPTIDVNQSLMRFLKNEPIAIISVRDQFYQIASKSNYSSEFLCERISQVPVEGAVVKGGMIIAKSSPFRKLFNFQTIMIQERGLDSRLAHHYTSDYTPFCVHKNRYSLETYTLGINDVFTAFAILFCAILTSSFTLLYETFIFNQLSQCQCQIPFFHGKFPCYVKQ